MHHKPASRQQATYRDPCERSESGVELRPRAPALLKVCLVLKERSGDLCSEDTIAGVA